MRVSDSCRAFEYVLKRTSTYLLGRYQADQGHVASPCARAPQPRACGPEMCWGVRYAEDADHGDP
eukprot:3534020-Prymnesium_polylepis.1